MAELPVRRVFVPDIRGYDQYLRATWHPETGVVVVSHWVGDVCVASTPVSVTDASALIGLLVSALQETATKTLEEQRTTTAPTPPLTIVNRLRSRLRPRLAQIIALRSPSSPGEDAVPQTVRRSRGRKV